MSTFKIDAELRDDLGKGASRRLRRESKVPAIIYGGNKDPRSISLNHLKVLRYIEEESFFTSILELKAAGGKKQKVILRDMQRHPSKPVIMHMDFMRIDDNVELTISIPVHSLNEEESPAGKEKGIIIAHMMTEVEISCLPANLPEFIEVDLIEFADGDMIHLSDLKLPKGVSLTAFNIGEDESQDDYDAVVISTTHVQKEEDPEPTDDAEAPSAEVPTHDEEKEAKKEE